MGSVWRVGGALGAEIDVPNPLPNAAHSVPRVNNDILPTGILVCNLGKALEVLEG